MADKNDFVVSGFQFGSQNDAELAKNEKARIQKLESKLDYDNPQMVNAVFKKAITNRVFKTPVGYEFLRKLQIVLKESTVLDEDIADIPVYGVFSLRDEAETVKEKIKPSTKKPPKKDNKDTFSKRASITLNIVLVILVGVMFYISLTSSNPNVLNYERAVQNKYSQWEQELSDREAVIRDKEKELLINE